MADQTPARPIKAPFNTLREWGEWLNAHAGPAPAADIPVLAGQTGPRRRASHEDLMALVEEQRAKYARKRG